MCGITGLFSPQGVSPYRSALIAAHDLVQHRGPDGDGFVLLDTRTGLIRETKGAELPDRAAMAPFTLALGHHRLAIVDLSALGHQPMTNEDHTIWITYNGEVYNYLELRAELQALGHVFRSGSDTEVVLRAYATWGEGCVDRFNGMWAFAIADFKREQLFCSRDRFGVKPFHYYHDGTHFIFGSEIKQLLTFPDVQKRVNERAVYEFLVYAAVEGGDETFFAGISKLLPGHNLTVDLKTSAMKVTCYYHPKLVINDRISLAGAGETFHRIFVDSVRLRLRSDVEVGSCLSGGLDSSSIVCVAQQLLKERGNNELQHTFSSHFVEEEANEVAYMQEVIRAIGVQAHLVHPSPEELLRDLERLVWHQEEPFGSTSIFAQWAVFKQVGKDGVKVMLDGQGADEQLAGYIGLSQDWFQELRAKGAWARLAWEMWRRAQLHEQPWLSMAPGGMRAMLRRLGCSPGDAASAPAIDWISPSLARRYEGHSYYQANLEKTPFGKKEKLNNALFQLTFFNNLPGLLKYEDRNSMAFSVESRLPFLDYRLVEFLFSLPSDMKIRHGYTKWVLRQGMRGVLPEKIRWRVSKLGFATPERAWRRTVLRPLIEQALKGERLRAFLDRERALSYLNRIEQLNLQDSAPWRWVSLDKWLAVYGLA